MSAGEQLGGALAVTCITLGLITWPLAFNLGAYGEVLYEDIFRVVVASSGDTRTDTLARQAHQALHPLNLS